MAERFTTAQNRATSRSNRRQDDRAPVVAALVAPVTWLERVALVTVLLARFL
jgi:hypothetical protein